MNRLLWVLCLNLAPLVCGCPASVDTSVEGGRPPTDGPTAPEFTLRWAPGVLPVDVLASDALNDCQLEAIELGAELWSSAVDAPVFRVVRTAAGHPSMQGRPPLHTVPVSSSDLDPGVLGRATLSWDGDRVLQSARIELDEPNGCRNVERIAAHELGHALGLEHAAHPQCVMYMSIVDGPWGIHDREVAWVRAQLGAR